MTSGTRPAARRWAGLLAAVLLGLAPACDGGGGPPAAPPAAPPATDAGTDPGYRADPRIQALLAGCPQTEYYTRSTAHALPILLEKLERGYTEPLQRAKEELAAMGAEAIREVRRLADRHFADPLESAVLQNALDVAILSDAPGAREVTLRFLDHPRSVLRVHALRGMRNRHVRPEDFDRLWAQLEIESSQGRELIVACLHAAQPGRAEELFLDWIERGEYQALWSNVAPYLARSEEPSVAERCGSLYPSTRVDVRPFLAVCAARAGDEVARSFLRDELAAEETRRRVLAAQALTVAGEADELEFSLLNDPEPQVRLFAARALALAEPSERRSALLQQGINDADAAVRIACLKTLIAEGDATAVDRALSMLRGSLEELNEALTVLRDPWLADEELARRGFDLLVARDREERHRALGERRPVLKAIAQVPLADAARYLREVALGAGDVELGGLRAHHWVCVQAANTGEAGRAWLFGELERERDPSRRLDLVWAATTARTDGSRERLHALLDAFDELSVYEVLFASDILARLGPTERVAPRLKRACYRIEEPDEVRLAMRCLLWKWY